MHVRRPGTTGTCTSVEAACERAAEERMPGRVLHVRPGHDRRSVRLQRSVHVLGEACCRRRRSARAWPARAASPVRFDARDRRSGSCAWPKTERQASSMRPARRIVDVRSHAGRLPHVPAAMPVHVDGRGVLLDRGVPRSELPLRIPDADNGIFEVRNDKAIAKRTDIPAVAGICRDTARMGSPPDG